MLFRKSLDQLRRISGIPDRRKLKFRNTEEASRRKTAHEPLEDRVLLAITAASPDDQPLLLDMATECSVDFADGNEAAARTGDGPAHTPSHSQ